MYMYITSVHTITGFKLIKTQNISKAGVSSDSKLLRDTAYQIPHCPHETSLNDVNWNGLKEPLSFTHSLTHSLSHSHGLPLFCLSLPPPPSLLHLCTVKVSDTTCMSVLWQRVVSEGHACITLIQGKVVLTIKNTLKNSKIVNRLSSSSWRNIHTKDFSVLTLITLMIISTMYMYIYYTQCTCSYIKAQ